MLVINALFQQGIRLFLTFTAANSLHAQTRATPPANAPVCILGHLQHDCLVTAQLLHSAQSSGKSALLVLDQNVESSVSGDEGLALQQLVDWRCRFDAAAVQTTGSLQQASADLPTWSNDSCAVCGLRLLNN
jgi:hypothetical protein